MDIVRMDIVKIDIVRRFFKSKGYGSLSKGKWLSRYRLGFLRYRVYRGKI